MRKLNEQDLEERAAEARNFLNSPIINEMFEEIRQECLDIFTQAEVGDLTAARAHGIIKALELVRGKMQTYVDAKKFHRK